MSKFENQAYAILRIITGFLFLWHGSQKLFGFPPAGMEMPEFIVWVAGPIEFIGGILIMVGLFTRWVAFISCGEMAFAYWMAHGTVAILPIMNHGELALFYCFILLFISAKGSGVFSIDHYLCKGKTKL
ncbi:MAG: DoxX family protein [Bacteroidales bacterium]|jgi:putative oxidoreductase